MWSNSTSLASKAAAAAATGSARIGMSTEPYHSDLRMHDDHGAQIPFSQHPTFRAPIFVNVESARRDTRLYPDPRSFQLHFNVPLRGVAQLELLDICVPNMSGVTTPRDNYFFLANGLIDSSTGRFSGSSSDNIVSMYTDMDAERTRTAPVYNVSGPCVTPTAGGNSYTSTLMPDAALAASTGASMGCHSFGKFCYDENAGVQHWERTHARKVVYFKPERGRLGSLQFSLVERDGLAYDHATVPYGGDWGPQEWTCTLMICARAD